MCVSHCSGPAVNKTDKDLAHLELTFLVEKMDKQANKRKMYILNCESCSVVSDSLQPHGLQPTRLLHPWDFPGKSTGVGSHCLLH